MQEKNGAPGREDALQDVRRKKRWEIEVALSIHGLNLSVAINFRVLSYGYCRLDIVQVAKVFKINQ